MLLAQEYVPDLSEYKDRFMRTPLGLLTQGNVSGAVDRLGADAQGRVQAMMNPESALQTGMDFMGGGLLGTIKNLAKGQKVFYHVTDPSNVENIIKEGIKPNKSKTGFSKGMMGQTLSEKGKVYAFDNYNDALRWQSKMNWDVSDPNKASQIIPYVDDASKYIKDTHSEYSNYIGAFKKEGSVNPNQFLDVKYTRPINKVSSGEKVGEYTVEELNKFKNTIPYLQEARMLSDRNFFNPYATTRNTQLNPVRNFWESQGLSQRPINEEDFGILLQNK